jgi:type I site-specific restriction-modification system R (restriction) subunit
MIDELRELLNARESGGIIFTTVQKFALPESRAIRRSTSAAISW